MDIFNDDAFSLSSLTAAINEMDYKPGRLGKLGLFQESGVTQQTHGFKFSVSSTDVRAQADKARSLVDDAMGALPNSGLRAFCGSDFVETVNTISLPRYAKQKVMDFGKGVIVHTESNPLPINLKPRGVIRLTMS